MTNENLILVLQNQMTIRGRLVSIVEGLKVEMPEIRNMFNSVNLAGQTWDSLISDFNNVLHGTNEVIKILSQELESRSVPCKTSD